MIVSLKPLRKQMPSHQTQDTKTLILASSSRYRAEMLSRLGLPFQTQSPDIDETRLAGETPLATAQRLSQQKALKVARQWPGAVVIGADQVLDLHGDTLGKPGTHPAALAQLTKLSGQVGIFSSAVTVLSPGFQQRRVSQCRARFRKLSPAQIEYYLLQEQPYDTAGSAKAEGLCIALLESLSSDDPTSIVGLPLIMLTAMLARVGLDPLG